MRLTAHSQQANTPFYRRFQTNNHIFCYQKILFAFRFRIKQSTRGNSYIYFFVRRKPIANDTAKDKQLIVLLNNNNLEKLSQPVQWGLTELGSYNQPIYNRYEQFLLSAFNDMPFMKIPDSDISKTDRIFELRSYESPTEATYRNKVHMFNEGGEVKLFEQLGFNAVFYADVLFGSKMPNLMYMTSFSNIESRNEHWKQFGESATWKRLSSMDFYKNNMSALHSQLLKSTTYSDY